MEAKIIDASRWKTFHGRKPEYCLSEKVNQTCALRFSSSLAWVVISFNILKLLLLLACCLSNGPLGKERPILTVGDAISSYLRRNDETTRYLSHMGVPDLTLWTGVKTSHAMKDLGKEKVLMKGCLQWKKNVVLFQAVPLRRWIGLTLQ
jgi:hypothetical protein